MFAASSGAAAAGFRAGYCAGMAAQGYPDCPPPPIDFFFFTLAILVAALVVIALFSLLKK